MIIPDFYWAHREVLPLTISSDAGQPWGSQSWRDRKSARETEAAPREAKPRAGLRVLALSWVP